MCGIHFVVTSDTFASGTEKYMNDAFVANSVRGMHSSGVFQVDPKGEISMYKKATNGANFIGENGAKTILAKTGRSPLTVGHVRHATQGEINDDNAHPFIITRDDGSELVGVHNGTLRGWKNKSGGKDQVVDSAWAFQKLADEGEDAFQYFDGAFAFVWYDSNDPGYVWMARNKERPMHMMASADRKTLLGASELGMLGWLADRNGIKPYRDKQFAFMYLEENVLYRYSLKDPSQFTTYKMQKYDPRTTIYTPPPTNHYGRSMHPSYNQSQWNRGRYSNDSIPWDGEGEFEDWDSWGRGHTTADWATKKQTELFADVAAALDEVIANARQDDEYAPEVNDGEMEALKSGDPATFHGISDSIRKWRRGRPTEKEKAAGQVIKAAQEIRTESILDSNPVFLSNPNDSAATKGEKAGAQGLGVWGQVGKFYGILHDPEEGTVQGQLIMYSQGKEVEVEAEIRYVTTRGAQGKYVDRVEPTLVAVIGVVPATQVFPVCYVVADLTNSNKAQLEQHITRLTKAN